MVQQNKTVESDNWVEQAERYWSQSDKSKEAAQNTLSYIEKALQSNPLNYKAWADKGFILKQLGEFESAILCLDRALLLNNNFISPLYNKGVLLGLMGKFNEALIYYDRVLKIEPNHQLAIRDKQVLLQIINRKK
jgi:tetratricopeptide (TPR) repeat protein